PSGLGEIQVLRTIGRGGMGVVYEGFDTVLRRRVALKKLRPEIAEDPREVEEFLREARTVAGLSHPNIVQIHTVLRHGKGVYLVFEYADGQTLDDLLAEEERLAPERALPFLDQIAAGLDYAHARDVVHRDLKPANVIISADGKAKIADFGMARVSRQSSARWSRSRGGGTPPYMAPEQALGEEGPPADIFALGACAYELLSGKRPYADGAMDLKRLRAYAPLSSFGAELAGADSVIARALDPEPARRQASAGAFAAELRAALGA
ncbi:MAG TPA: serine/threonine-protein kinase, partial [Elusimicrobiota bacterium]|nr:serine/threonine-protein kinase [Elusimicrobiota bacterium]